MWLRSQRMSETYTSATGVARTAREMLEKRSTPSLLREMNPQDITSYDVFKAAEKGDENCLGKYSTSPAKS